MTINNNSVEQINVALLDMDKKLKSAISKSASASDFNNLEASVDNIKRTLNETKTGLEPGKTYNINISGNAATADKAKEAEKANKLVNALTVNGETYDGSEAVDAGVQKIENGGTGVTTQADINKAFIGNLDVGNDNVTDGTEFVSSWASDNGFAETTEGAVNKPYKRQFIKVWNYIKDKISSVLGLTKDNYGGKAASAGNADTVDNYHASDLWRSDGATWNPGADIALNAAANGNEWSFDIHRNGHTGCYWHVWDSSHGSLLKVNADDGKVSAPKGFVGNLSGKADTAGTAATILDYNRGTPIKVRWGGPGIDSADWYPAFNADGSALEPINGNNIRVGTANRAKNMYSQTFDLSSLDKTKFYPLVCGPSNNFSEVAIWSEGGMASIEYNQNRIHFDISTQGWSDLSYTLNIREYACYQNNEITIGCIGRGVHNGAWAIWLRGGVRYYCFTRDADLTLHTSDYTYGDETYTVGTNYYGGSNSNVEVWFTPQSTITNGSYSTRAITSPSIKANNRMVIPIGEPSSLEDGCLWIER